MKCDICGSENAAIHIQQIFDGTEINIKVCEKCARDKGLTLDNQQIGQSLKVLLSNFEQIKNVLDAKNDKRKCPVCGTEFSVFKKKCEAGCSECYKEFESFLKTFYKNTAGSSLHKGKNPGKISLLIRKKQNKARLENELTRAVSKEDYEKAAVLRDRIRFLGKYID